MSYPSDNLNLTKIQQPGVIPIPVFNYCIRKEVFCKKSLEQ